jgi:hypothetical protein
MGGGDFLPAKAPPDAITPRPTNLAVVVVEDYGLILFFRRAVVVAVVVVEPWAPILFFRRAVDVQ